MHVGKLFVSALLFTGAPSCDKNSDVTEGSSTAAEENLAPAACDALADVDQRRACAQWSDEFCGSEAETCTGEAHTPDGALLICATVDVWSGPADAECSAGTVEQACVPTLFYGDGDHEGGPWVRTDGQTTHVAKDAGVNNPIGYESCEEMDPMPAFCSCVP